ncbi:unnamed protein product [Zymoseptoria tritici ST99CH_3D1]|nr:unnamed protein product [Zymoseptoria tritici ST99CH_3D1]
MLIRSPPAARILSLRPLRPPSQLHLIPKPRLFTQNSQLLLVANHPPRPQLPYLSQPAFHRPAPLNGPSQQLARLLTTENRKYVKEQVWLATKWTALGWTFLALGAVAYYGILTETEERANPTPAEWNFWTRKYLRAGRFFSDPAHLETIGTINWVDAGSAFRDALARLEDPEREGKGLRSPDGGDILIPGVGRAGDDISEKSWPWRSGYFEVIMGCAKAAEHLDDMVLDTTRNLVFPKDVVLGPSNPDPRPTPPRMQQAPLEENCTAPCPPPETYYLRVLTGRGFTTKQKLDAALAYANWLEYKKLPDSAEEMYIWAVDIAKGALPITANADDILDSRTHVLKLSSHAESDITPNLLHASTALAVHHARNGNLQAALPIFLSVLRARRTAPVSPFPAPSTPHEDTKPSFLTLLTTPPAFPPPPPSGDIPLIRSTDRPTCEESELMLYIGEILFASAAREEGLGWTKQAVTIANADLRSEGTLLTVNTDRTEAEARKKCKECLQTGLANWGVMLRMLQEETETAGVEKKGWFGGWFGGGGGGEDAVERAKRLEGEMAEFEALRERVVREGIMESAGRIGGVRSTGGVWMG